LPELKIYDIGDVVTLDAEFEAWDDPSQTMIPADPTDVVCRVKQPGLPAVVLDYPADVDKLDVGKFRAEFEITISGVHTYRFEGTGAVPTAGERSFKARKSLVL
jgi:hypothetical protein